MNAPKDRRPLGETKPPGAAALAATQPANTVVSAHILVSAMRPPDEIVNANRYRLDDHGLDFHIVLDHDASPRGALTVVWLPKDSLPRLVMRDRARLRPIMAAWASKTASPLACTADLQGLDSKVYGANLAHFAVSDLGAEVRFYWASPTDVSNTPQKVKPYPVVELRMPPVVLGRLWMELDSAAGPDETEGPAEDAKNARSPK